MIIIGITIITLLMHMLITNLSNITGIHGCIISGANKIKVIIRMAPPL